MPEHLFDTETLEPSFDGGSYVPVYDQVRLTGQKKRVLELMNDNRWRTIQEIHDITGFPHASILARLCDFRKAKFGAYPVLRRHRGNPKHGLYEYQLGVKGSGVPRPNSLTVQLEEAYKEIARLEQQVVYWKMKCMEG